MGLFGGCVSFQVYIFVESLKILLNPQLKLMTGLPFNFQLNFLLKNLLWNCITEVSVVLITYIQTCIGNGIVLRYHSPSCYARVSEDTAAYL